MGKKPSGTRPFYALFTYSVSDQPTSKRVRFVYALKGRKGEDGIVEYYGGEFLAPACFLVPWTHAKDLKEVFGTWEIGYTVRKIKVLKEEVNVLSKNRKK